MINTYKKLKSALDLITENKQYTYYINKKENTVSILDCKSHLITIYLDKKMMESDTDFLLDCGTEYELLMLLGNVKIRSKKKNRKRTKKNTHWWNKVFKLRK